MAWSGSSEDPLHDQLGGTFGNIRQESCRTGVDALVGLGRSAASAWPARACPGVLARDRGRGGAAKPPVALEHVRIDPRRSPPPRSSGCATRSGQKQVREDHEDRVGHAAGKGYPDLVRLRAGAPEGAPDAVLYPSFARAATRPAGPVRARIAGGGALSVAAPAWLAGLSLCAATTGRWWR